MTLRHSVIAMVAGMAAVGATALPARALVVCKKKSGAIFLRDACKKKETVVDPASFGATGPQGPPGQQGPQGPPGSAGQATAIDFRVPVDTPSMVIFDSGKLQLAAACDAAGVVTVTATTSVDNATLQSFGNMIDSAQNNFDTAMPLTIDNDVSEERTIVYTEPGGQIVVLPYLVAENMPLGGTVACLVSGLAFVH
jgi:hypothetical protein